MKLTLCIAILLFLSSFIGYSQQLVVNNNNGTDEIWSSANITSDYGRREVGSLFHDGVDFSTRDAEDLGYDIRSINGGSIGLISVNSIYKAIAIVGSNGVNYGYGHIFSDQNASQATSIVSQNFTAMYVDDLEDFALIYNAGQADSYALTHVNPIPDGASFTIGTETYSVENQNLLNEIDLGTKIGPIGNSGGNNYPTHIHLYNFVTINRENDPTPWSPNSNTKDPLQHLINHSRPGYDVTLEIKNTDENGIAYSINPSFRLRADFSNWTGNDDGDSNELYEDVANDLSQAKILIRPVDKTVFSLIQGAYFDSRISEGATLYGEASDRYPQDGVPTSTNSGPNHVDIEDNKTDPNTSAGYGDYQKTGIVGASYAGTLPAHVRANYPANSPENEGIAGAWDDYFFNDFPTRISSIGVYGGNDPDMASQIEEAVYPDGEYQIMGRVENIFGSYWVSNIQSLIIDNFRPFVKRVLILRNNKEGALLYHGRMEYNGNGYDYLPESWNSIGASDQLFVEIEFSEPMIKSTVSVEVIDNLGSSFAYESPDHKTFHFELPALGSTKASRPQTLTISGQDLNHNPLQTNPNVVSIRTGEGANAWFPPPVPGADTNFTFNESTQACGAQNIANGESVPTLKVAATGDCIYVAFTASKQNPAAYEPVVFSPIGSDDPNLSYSWSFGSNAIPSTSTDREVTVMFTTEGPQTISLEICDGIVCETSPTEEFNVSSQSSQLNIDFEVVGSNVRSINENITLSSTVTGNNGAVQYFWDFGFAANSNDENQSNPIINYSMIGSKSVSLIVKNGDQRQRVYKSDFLTIKHEVNPINVTLNCPTSGNRYLNLQAYNFISNADTDGEIGNERILWNFGDGQISSSKNVLLLFNSPGTYTIKLTACDDSGCSTSQCYYHADESFFSTGNYNFTLNGELAGEYYNGSYTTNSISNIAAKFPLVLNDASGKILNYSESQIEYSIYKGNAAVPFLTLSGRGPHEVNLPDPYSYYTVYYRVGPVGQNFQPFAIIYADETSQISERCLGSFNSLILNETCWDDNSPPTFNVDIETNGCPYGLVELIDTNTDEVISTSTDNFTWLASQKPTSFPYSTTVEARAYYLCKNGNSCERLITKQFDITINSASEISLDNQYSTCVGSSTVIGPEPSSAYIYKWSAVGTSDIKYLSDPTIANPTFVAYQSGTYQYDLTITDHTSGCSSTERITIATSGVEIESYAITTDVGSRITLKSPVIGGGADYEYEWSPATYLDNPNVASPVLSAPTTATTKDYVVDISYRGICTASATVSVAIVNPPPSNLSVTLNGSGLPYLSWLDNSIESYFIVERSEDGGATWETIGTSESNMDAFLNFQCLVGGTEYCYRVKAYDNNNNYIGKSNKQCLTLPFFVHYESTIEQNSPVDFYWGSINVNAKSMFYGNGGNVSIHDQLNSRISFLSGNYRLDNHANGTLYEVGVYIINYASETDLHRYNGTSLSSDADFETNIEFWPTDFTETRNQYVQIFSGPISEFGNNMTVDPVMASYHYYRSPEYSQWWDTKYIWSYIDNSQCCDYSSYDQFIIPNSPVLTEYIDQDYYSVSASSISPITNRSVITLFRLNGNFIRSSTTIESSSSNLYLNDLETYNGNIYLAINNTIHTYIYKVNGQTLTTEASKLSFGNYIVESKPQIGAYNNHIYFIGNTTDSTFYAYKYDLNLSEIWKTAIKLDNKDAKIRSIEFLGDEIIIIAQKDSKIGFVSIDQEGNKRYEKFFDEANLDYLIGSTKVNDWVIVDYIKTSSEDYGETASSVFSRELKPEESISICQEDIYTNKVYFANTITVSDNCETTLSAGDQLSLYASESITLKSGFHAKKGSSLTIQPAVFGECANQSSARFSSTNDVIDEQFITDSETGIVNIYPNPTSDFLSISYQPPVETDVKLVLYSTSGTAVYEKHYPVSIVVEDQLNVQGLTSGLYIVSIQTRFGNVTRKVVIR